MHPLILQLIFYSFPVLFIQSDQTASPCMEHCSLAGVWVVQTLTSSLDLASSISSSSLFPIDSHLLLIFITIIIPSEGALPGKMASRGVIPMASQQLLNSFTRMLVVMSCSENRPVDFPVVFAKLRSELISLVRQLQQEHRQSLQMCECLVSPSLVQRYPFDDLPDTDLFVIQDVAESILLQKKLICSQNKACKGLSTQSLLPFEPYHLISPSYVCKLFNSDMANQPVPGPLCQEVQKHFHLGIPQMYKELRKKMDKLSIFAGRNPLVIVLIACYRLNC